MAIDVAEADFQREVLDRSHELPVVVDFWAAWCGPCRALTPALEAAAEARAGKVVLAKVDTDLNPALSSSFAIQSIPAVKAFRDGAVIDEFTGALAPAAVQRFFDGIVPTEADGLVAAGGEANLRRALELEPGRTEVAVALARLLLAHGESEAAAGLLDSRSGFAAEGLAARIALADDPALSPALAHLDAGETEPALDALLTALGEADDEPRRDALRRLIVGVLDELGVDHPLARDARRRLAIALF